MTKKQSNSTTKKLNKQKSLPQISFILVLSAGILTVISGLTEENYDGSGLFLLLAVICSVLSLIISKISLNRISASRGLALASLIISASYLSLFLFLLCFAFLLA